ncbi:uncharacterized protein L199_008695 [Kwoniella botswanensis]|uniref:uncharacterized protein n=1 Tax=Kwoniella botswanensis TaxID=1268659 RepID=UPI00315CCA8A
MKLALATSLSLLVALVLVTSRSSAAPSTSSSSITGSHMKPSFSNRVILIRHAEKGFSPAVSNPNSVNSAPSDSAVSSSRGGSWWSWLWGFPSRPPRASAPLDRGPPGDDRGRGPPGRGGGGQGGPRWPGRGKFPNGLSEKGKERAQYIRTYFGNDSEFDIGLIFAAPREGEGEKEAERTYATVAPLAKDLGLEINIACANSAASCILQYVQEFAQASNADILISWKHRDLNTIATALGATNAHRIYPDERNDVVWIMSNGQIVEKRSMHCPGLDDDRVDQGDPDLEVEQPRDSLSWTEWLSSWAGLKYIWGAQRKVVTVDSL